MPKVTPEQFADKLIRRLSGATSDIQQGVQRVTESPTSKAAAKQDKMLNNLTEAVRSGKWANRLKAVSTEEWKEKMVNVGVPRIASGVEAARPKIESFARELLSYQEGLQRRVQSMPDLTLEQNIARMTEWVKGMAQFKRSK
jgi:hypothetical protein